MLRRNPLNRLLGRVHGWFESKEAQPGSFLPRSLRSQPALMMLEDRSVPATLTLNLLAETIDTNDNLLSLPEAITAINAGNDSNLSVAEKTQVTGTFGTNDKISFGTLSGTLTITNALVGFTVPVTISGGQTAGVNNVTINGGGTTPIDVLNVPSGSISVANLDFTNCDSAILIENQTVTATSCNFISNVSAADGAAIFMNSGGKLSLQNCNFTGNTSTGGGGGAVYLNNGGSLTVANSTFSGNVADFYGGAISAFAADVTVTDTSFTNNIGSKYFAGALIVFSGGAAARTVTMTNCTISGNSGPRGGAITLRANAGDTGALNLNLTNCTITNNKAVGGGATFRGGAIYVSGFNTGNGNSNVTISGSTITGNSSQGTGGVLHSILATTGNITNVNISKSIISGNTAGTNAGVLYLGRGSNVTVDQSTLSDNFSKTGAGGAIRGISAGISTGITITNSTLSGNSAATQGGAVYTSGTISTFTVRNSTIANNTAGTEGGGFRLLNPNGNLNVRNSTVVGNTSNSTSATAGNGGGGFAVSGTGTATLNIASTIISGNSQPAGGNFHDVSIGTGNTFTGSNSAVGVSTGHTPLVTLPTAGATNLAYGTNLLMELDGLGKPVLANNNGLNPPTTKTIQLLVGSPAIDAGSNPDALSFDQRGTPFNRVVTGKTGGSPVADIGAFEFVPALVPVASGVFSPITTLSGGGKFDSNNNYTPATSYSVTVTYNAPGTETINTGTLDVNDIRVTSPVGTYNGIPTGVTFTSPDGNKTVVATYTLPSNPNNTGAWDFLDNGLYTVVVQGAQVSASGGGTVAAGKVNDFTVDVGRIYTVNTDSDFDDGDITNATTSLREALVNSTAAVINGGTPTALDLVYFDPAFFTSSKTITASSTGLAATGSVHVINNTGKSITLDTSIAARAFTFDDATTGTIEGRLFGVNISGSASGGGLAIGANDSFTFENGTISGGTIFAFGGGAFVSAGATFNLTNSTISGNSAVTGGGVYFDNGGSFIMTGSTVSGNVATGINGGGGLYFFGNAASDKLRILNSTISGNSAIVGGGIALRNNNAATNLQVLNSTIAFNTATTGGGIARENTLAKITITSSIVASNLAETGKDINVAGNGNTDVISATFSALGSDPGVSLSAASKLPAAGNLPFGSQLYLTPLFNFGGPTSVHGIASGSAASDKGTSVGGVTPSTDQRGAGFPRVVGSAADIGAFEGALARPGASTSLVNITPGSSFDGKSTGTILVKYSAQPGQTISASEFGTSDISVTGPGGALNVSAFSAVDTSGGLQTSYDVTYTIDAPGGTWNAPDRGRYTVAVGVNEVKSSNTVPVLEGTLGNFLAVYGNTFVVDTDQDIVDPNDNLVSLREAVLDANDPNRFPGQDTITFFKGTPTGGQFDFTNPTTITLATQILVTDSLIINGTGSSNLSIGGAGNNRHFTIGNSTNNFEVSGVTFTGGFAANTAAGGSMVLDAQVAKFTDVTFTNNSAGANAVWISRSSSKVTMINCSVTNNAANGSFENAAALGWANNDDSVVFTAINLTANGNTNAGVGRGSVMSFGGTANVTITNSNLSSNTASGGIGGVVYFTSTTAPASTLLIDNSILSNNSCGGFGTVVATFGALNATIRNSTFANNLTPQSGGVIHYNDSGAGSTLLIDSSTFSGNAASGFGGGVLNINGGTATVRNSTFSGNQSTAAGAGGGASVLEMAAGTTLNVENSTFNNNTTAATGTGAGVGGAIGSQGGTVNIVSSVLFGNTAGNGRDDIASTKAVTQNFSLVFDSDGFTLAGGSGNNIAAGTDPLFDPAGLVNNGGPTDTIALQAGSPLINAGSNPSGSFRDQRGFFRVIGSAADIGAYEFGSSAALPAVTSIVVNDGATQRSRLTKVVVNFASPVDASLLTAAGKVFFTRTSVATNGVEPVGTIVNNTNGLIITPTSGTVSSVTLTFQNIDNTGIDFGSLSDGRWQLSIVDAGFTSPNSPTDTALRRLFGNVNNDTTVDGTDFGAYPPFGAVAGNPFDYNNDGSIDANDFGQFGNRFGFTLV